MIRLQNTEESISNTFVNDLRTKLSITRIYAVIMTILCCLLGFGYIRINNRSIDTMNDMVFNHTTEIIELSSEYEQYKSDTAYIYTQLESMSNSIVELLDISEELDAQNQILQSDNLELMNIIDVYQTREELFNKYEYAIYDTANKRTDITYEQLKNLESMVEESEIQDTDLILALVMTESNGTEKAKNPNSTAKGYGQFLDGTSKFVYTDLLNYSNWKPEVAYDGDINLEMIVTYLDYLYENNNGNLYAAIRNYRGDDITKYVKKMDTYLSSVNKSVYTISKK